MRMELRTRSRTSSIRELIGLGRAPEQIHGRMRWGSDCFVMSWIPEFKKLPGSEPELNTKFSILRKYNTKLDRTRSNKWKRIPQLLSWLRHRGRQFISNNDSGFFLDKSQSLSIGNHWTHKISICLMVNSICANFDWILLLCYFPTITKNL